jgi:UrcA family protein
MMHVRAWRPAVFSALMPVLVLSAAPAFAADGATTANGNDAIHHIAVQYGDLDLSQAKGRHILESRLRHSAASVCDYDLTDSHPLINAQRDCFETALRNAHVTLAMKQSQARMASSR